MNLINTLKKALNKTEFVSINEENIRKFVQKFNENKIKHWLTISPIKLTDLNKKELTAFLFILNSISFSYWGEPKWKIKYKNKIYDGAQAMMICLKQEIQRNKKFIEPKYLANLEETELKKILKGNVEIPLFEARLKFLRELGKITSEKFENDFREIIKQAKEDSVKFIRIVTKNFPLFQDEVEFNNYKIGFNKRAQLLTADLGQVWNFKNNDKLTACADYKIPHMLRKYNIIKYNEQLKEKILRKQEIKAGSREEIEIRGMTILAVEKIKKELKKKYPHQRINSNQINDYLWLESQIKSDKEEPYHLTRTTNY